MKRKLSLLLALLMLAACLFGGCGKKEETPANTQEPLVREVFYGENGEIPCLELVDSQYATANMVEWTFTEVGKDASGNTYGYADESITQIDAPIFNWYYGDGVYLTRYARPAMNAYSTLLEEMKKAGYQVYSSGMLNDGDVSYALLTYQDCVYDLIYCPNNATLTVTASKSRPLSPYLLEDNASTRSQAIPGLDTKLTMLRCPQNGGDNYIIQLKNGHFILFDGGSMYSLAQTLEFLHANTPAGQIPVVEAWFLTHGHFDHVGWTRAYTMDDATTERVMGGLDLNNRIRVNGIYYNMPKEEINDNTVYGWRGTEPTTSATGMRTKNSNPWPYQVHEAARKMLTEDGTQTPIYRPQTGQTFYFKDLTVEVPYTQEHITFSEYQMDLNAASTWYLIRAEGRTFLEAGDTEDVNLGHVEKMYSPIYEAYRPDIMSAFHHGHNIYSEYIDTFNAPIVFYTISTMYKWASQYNQANKDMLSKLGVTYYCYGDGAYQYNFATGQVTQIG